MALPGTGIEVHGGLEGGGGAGKIALRGKPGAERLISARRSMRCKRLFEIRGAFAGRSMRCGLRS